MSKERKRTWEVQVGNGGYWECWSDHPTKKEALENAEGVSRLEIYDRVRVVRYDATTTIEVKA